MSASGEDAGKTSRDMKTVSLTLFLIHPPASLWPGVEVHFSWVLWLKIRVGTLRRGIHQALAKSKIDAAFNPASPSPRLTMIHSEFHSTMLVTMTRPLGGKLCHTVIEISLKKHLTPLSMGNILWSLLMCLILFPIQFHFFPMPVTTLWEKPCPEKLPHTCTKWHPFIVALSRRGKTSDKKKNLRHLTCPSTEQINKWRYFHIMNYIQ